MKRIDLSKTSAKEVIAETCQVLAAGGLVIFPTETVYGAGVDTTSQVAVTKLLAYKSRREGKPLSIAVATQAMAEQYVELNDQARNLYQQFLPGPLTVVSKSLGKVAPGVESEFGSLGVRIPDYLLLLDLIKAYGKPITATSANASGKKRPYTVDDALNQLSVKQLALVDLILDAGELPRNEPSAVIDTTLSTPLTVRTGALLTQLHLDQSAFISPSETETKAIAGKLILKHWNQVKRTGLVIGLDGSLGAGKTIFAKGVAQFLDIDEPITSPTYTYLEEYAYDRSETVGVLHHLDLWKINSESELRLLEIEKLVKPGNVILVEWWSQVAEWLLPVIANKTAPLLTVSIADHPQGRSIAVKEPDEK
ncbi:MAG: hypothetical protein COY81_03470 [Candidatus Pacebacteria bacterium CG_4_10_14_0_8_um_filter_43_12]|nr:MAG: hypothetical protein COY81_03470 [Candidatus Pacebacteria bacterium CG_4_10_14_0_8_um_filter_43_12]